MYKECMALHITARVKVLSFSYDEVPESFPPLVYNGLFKVSPDLNYSLLQLSQDMFGFLHMRS